MKSDRDKTPTSWSRDGRFLSFESFDPKTQRDIWILPLEGERKPFTFLRARRHRRVEASSLRIGVGLPMSPSATSSCDHSQPTPARKPAPRGPSG